MKNARSHILSTSFKFFLEKGYSGVSMSDLVKASGLSKGAFYYYFSSKEKLYEETLNEYFFEYLGKFDLKYKAEMTFKENIRYIYTSIVEMMEEIQSIIGSEIHIISYYRTIWESMTRNPEIREQVNEYYKIYIKTIHQWIEKAKIKNEIKEDLDSETLSFHITSLIEGTLVIYSFQEPGIDLQTLFDRLFNQLCDLFLS